MNYFIFENMNYEEVMDYAVSNYLRSNGEIKMKSIIEKVMTSNKISGLISAARYKVLIPGPMDYLACINEIPYFIFSKNNTQAIAALISLMRWNKEVNENQDLCPSERLKNIAVKIIIQSKAEL